MPLWQACTCLMGVVKDLSLSSRNPLFKIQNQSAWHPNLIFVQVFPLQGRLPMVLCCIINLHDNCGWHFSYTSDAAALQPWMTFNENEIENEKNWLACVVSRCSGGPGRRPSRCLRPPPPTPSWMQGSGMGTLQAQTVPVTRTSLSWCRRRVR
jgi:hypothetical protein